tara:strand:- start:292 stop:723 length:432 start_codon:yes stop_codon:yes gene_type:complete
MSQVGIIGPFPVIELEERDERFSTGVLLELGCGGAPDMGRARLKFLDWIVAGLLETHGSGRQGACLRRYPPYSPSFSIATRVVEGDFIVPYDLVVKVGDIQCPVSTKAQVHRSKPRILTGHEVRLLHRHRGSAGIFDPIVVDH